MKKIDFVREITTKVNDGYDRPRFSQNDVKVLLDAIQDIVYQAAKNEDEVSIINGLTLTSTIREAHTARNPRTGETFDVPAKRIPKVKIGKNFKDAVLG